MLSNQSQRADEGRSNLDTLTFAGDRPTRDPRELDRVETLNDRIDIPNTQKRLKSHLELPRGRDSFDLVLQPSHSMVAEESQGLDQSYPDKDIPLLRAMSENNKNGGIHLEYPHSPLFKSGMNGASRSSGFKLVQPGPKLQNRQPPQAVGPITGPTPMLNGTLVAGINPYYNQNSPGQMYIPIGQFGSTLSGSMYPYVTGLHYAKVDSNRLSVHNSNSKTRPVAIIPHDDELNLNQNEGNP